MTDDRSKDTSTALTEVRTVHSRALSAIDRLEGKWSGDRIPDPDYPDWVECRDSFPELTYAEWHDGYVDSMMDMADPDHDEMIAALRQVAELLEPWKKHGRRR